MSLMVTMTLRAVADLFRRAALACALCDGGVPHAPGTFARHEVVPGVLVDCAAADLWGAA